MVSGVTIANVTTIVAVILSVIILALVFLSRVRRVQAVPRPVIPSPLFPGLPAGLRTPRPALSTVALPMSSEINSGMVPLDREIVPLADGEVSMQGQYGLGGNASPVFYDTSPPPYRAPAPKPAPLAWNGSPLQWDGSPGPVPREKDIVPDPPGPGTPVSWNGTPPVTRKRADPAIPAGPGTPVAWNGTPPVTTRRAGRDAVDPIGPGTPVVWNGTPRKNKVPDPAPNQQGGWMTPNQNMDGSSFDLDGLDGPNGPNGNFSRDAPLGPIRLRKPSEPISTGQAFEEQSTSPREVRFKAPASTNVSVERPDRTPEETFVEKRGGVLDIVNLSNTTVVLTDDRSLEIRKLDSRRNVTSNVSLSRLEHFSGNLYALGTDGKLYLLDIASFPGKEWIFQEVPWASGNLAWTSSTHDGHHLWFQTGRRGWLRSASGQMGEFEMQGELRVYGSSPENYLELYPEKGIAVVHPGDRTYPGIANGILDKDDKPTLIRTKQQKQVRHVRLVNWEPYVVPR